MKRPTLLFLLAFLLAACAAPPAATPAGIPTSETPDVLSVPLGESRALPDGSAAVEFLEVLEDSRCPANAMCVWAGRVQVALAVTYGTEQVPVTLTLGELQDGEGSFYGFPQFILSLEAVNPYPGTAEEGATPVAVLRVERNAP